MPPTLTNRELKNKSTGIDIIVPEYQVIPGKIVNTVLYHVIVISRLFYFKTRLHKESDLVQFAVAKKYEEVEELHSKLVAKFPSVKFPSQPKMSLIITEKTLNERKAFLEQLMKLVAQTPKLCSSSPVLSFLEVGTISIKQNKLSQPEPGKLKVEDEPETKQEPERDIFGVANYGSSDEETDSSLSGSDQQDATVVDRQRPSGPQPKPTSPQPGVAATKTEGDVSADGVFKTSGKFSFGSHDVNERDLSDLFIPDEAKKFYDVKLFENDDDDHELLHIEDDLDKLLNIPKKTKENAPSKNARTTPKPDIKPRPTPKPRFAESAGDAEDDFLTKPVKPAKPEEHGIPVQPKKSVQPEKPIKPTKPVKPVKPAKLAKPEIRSKPDSPVKPVAPPRPKPRTRAKAPLEEMNDKKFTTVQDEVKPMSKSTNSLEDVFIKPSRKDLFGGIDEDEEDLFKLAPEPEDIDDITKYIENNIGKIDEKEVDLFS